MRHGKAHMSVYRMSFLLLASWVSLASESWHQHILSTCTLPSRLLVLICRERCVTALFKHAAYRFTAVSGEEPFISQPSCIIFDWPRNTGVLKPDPMPPLCPRLLNLQVGEIQSEAESRQRLDPRKGVSHAVTKQANTYQSPRALQPAMGHGRKKITSTGFRRSTTVCRPSPKK